MPSLRRKDDELFDPAGASDLPLVMPPVPSRPRPEATGQNLALPAPLDKQFAVNKTSVSCHTSTSTEPTSAH